MYETKCNSCTQQRNRMTQRPSKNVKHAPALLFFLNTLSVSVLPPGDSRWKTGQKMWVPGDHGMKFYPRHSGRNIQRCVGTEQVQIQSEELSGSGIRRRGNSLCLRLNRKVDRTTRNIRGSPPRGEGMVNNCPEVWNHCSVQDNLQDWGEHCGSS